MSVKSDEMQTIVRLMGERETAKKMVRKCRQADMVLSPNIQGIL